MGQANCFIREERSKTEGDEVKEVGLQVKSCGEEDETKKQLILRIIKTEEKLFHQKPTAKRAKKFSNFSNL